MVPGPRRPMAVAVAETTVRGRGSGRRCAGLGEAARARAESRGPRRGARAEWAARPLVRAQAMRRAAHGDARMRLPGEDAGDQGAQPLAAVGVEAGACQAGAARRVEGLAGRVSPRGSRSSASPELSMAFFPRLQPRSDL